MFQEGSGTEPNRRNRTARNRTEPLQRTAKNRPVNRTVPSTCSVFPCIAEGHAGEYRFSALSGTKCSKTRTPAQHPQPCLLLLRKSNECRFPSHHTKTADDLYSPALPRARTQEPNRSEPPSGSSQPNPTEPELSKQHLRPSAKLLCRAGSEVPRPT